MLRYKLPDGRCSALRLLAALLAGITATAAAPADADLSHTAALAEIPAEVPPSSSPADWRRLLEPVAAEDGRPPVHLWLSQAWPLGLAVRSAPAAVLTLWLTGGVHQVLSWIAPARAALEDMPGRVSDHAPDHGFGRASDEALERALGLITVEPVIGAETSSYGYRRDPFTRRRKLHKGVDYRAPRGTPVFAAGPGMVRVARRKSGYGRVIMVDHGAGVETRYAHLQSIEIDAGERVSAGTRIGTVGSTGRATGPHLHFELRIDGDAHDPQEVLGPLLSAELADSAY
jgi:murein DD-endopeptidase MepM/ murein hydrolase activator NlpD